ncbi:MAG TPA: allophanate hydrolase [Dehalococcoidia bacterium]|nr:allophanate hydrolase [Dehalococcoidia bacterium]
MIWSRVANLSSNADNTTSFPRVVPAGDSAILIELGSEIDPTVNDQVYSLASDIENTNINGVTDLVPTYRSLLVNYDPMAIGFNEMHDVMNQIVENHSNRESTDFEPVVIELPVVYGGEDGPDIENVAGYAGISAAEVIEIHSSTDYRVYMIGFAPGFPYLGGLDERIATPRLKTPRVLVPAGSVGIAESQTGVYPNASPGGWQLIGRTATKLFDVNSPKPSKITPGSRVRFVPVDSYE